MNPMLTKCPVCEGDLVVTRLHCPACETTIEGSFAPGGSRLQEAFSPEQLKPLLPFSRLTAEQLQFILTFVRCEGRFNRMEDEMGLSYPTLRNRLNDIIRAMGYEPSREEVAAASAAAAASARAEVGVPVLSPAERQEVLELLSRGEIDMEEAKRRLRGERSSAD
jgi:hypothetical protein